MEEDSTVTQGPHFSFVESFLLILFNLIGDILDLFSPVGIIGFFVGLIFGPVTIFWLWMKNVDAISKNTIAQIADMIPFIEWLPIRTVAIIFTIISVNNPKKLGKAVNAIEKVSEIKK